MLKLEDLTQKQINDLQVIAGFNCGNIKCKDCPLLMGELQSDSLCGSNYVKHLLIQFNNRKEVK